MKDLIISYRKMLGNLWSSSESTAQKLGITEFKLSYLRENGFLKPGLHWKSSPHGQNKPWNPQVVYDIETCRKIIYKTNVDLNENTAA